MGEFKYVKRSDPDKEFLEFDDPNLEILETVPEETDVDYIRCSNCVHGTPETLTQHLVEDFNNRVVGSIIGKSCRKNLYKIEQCTFQKEVIHCKYDRKHEYRTINSSCDKAEKMPEKKEPPQTNIAPTMHGDGVHILHSAKVSSLIGGNNG